MNTERHDFGSLAELLKDNARWESHHPGGTASHDSKVHGFNETNSYNETIELTRTGWRKGAERVHRLRTELDGAVQALVAAKAATIGYDVQGDWVDMGRYLTGEPECCGTWDFDGEDTGDKVIKIVANICVSGAVEPETIFARGAACLAAVDILESLGKRVELWIAVGLEDSRNGRSETHIIAKPASQPVDTDRLAFVLCHPDYFRRIVFAHLEINNHNPSYCYPTPVNVEDEAIVLPELRTGRTPGREENIQQVLKICESAGIVFSDEDVQEIISKTI